MSVASTASPLFFDCIANEILNVPFYARADDGELNRVYVATTVFKVSFRRSS